jgi:hypothetical protein
LVVSSTATESPSTGFKERSKPLAALRSSSGPLASSFLPPGDWRVTTTLPLRPLVTTSFTGILGLFPADCAEVLNRITRITGKSMRLATSYTAPRASATTTVFQLTRAHVRIEPVLHRL